MDFITKNKSPMVCKKDKPINSRPHRLLLWSGDQEEKNYILWACDMNG